jgi:hypothetical protein
MLSPTSWLDAVRDTYPDIYGKYSYRYSQQQDIAKVHVLRAFDCATSQLKTGTAFSASELERVVAERAGVLPRLAAECIEALLLIREFLPKPSPISEPELRVAKPEDYDLTSEILDKWMRGWK